MIGFLPLKDYLLDNGWQTLFAWGSLLFIWVPVISIVTSLIRRLAKMKGNSQALRISFLSLWLLGLACIIGLLISLTNDFRYRSNANEQTVYLSDPKSDKLELHADRINSYYRRHNWLTMEPFANFDDDTVYVNNLRVRILKGSNDSFEVKLLKMSDGASRQQANMLSQEIDYNVTQRDSILSLSKGIAITEDRKFRNQQVYLTVYVPVGKRILVDGSVANWNGNFHIGWRDDNWRFHDDWNDDEMDWDHDVEYVMTEHGLERTDGKTNSNDNDRDVDNDANSDNNEELNDQNDNIERKLEENRRNREDLERQRQEMQEKMRRIDSELGKPLDTIPVTGKPSNIKTAAVMHTPISISHIVLSKLAI